MIKAIETVYRGYRFRSRLEARWAVFFDALGIEYKYEPQGFERQIQLDVPLSAGAVQASIRRSEVIQTGLTLTWEILDGASKGREISQAINLESDSGVNQLSAICHAVGVIVVHDSSELHGKPCTLYVGPGGGISLSLSRQDISSARVSLDAQVEPQTQTIRYLPDFYLPELETWVEVKGDRDALVKDHKRQVALHDFGGVLPGFENGMGTRRGLLLLGEIPEPKDGVIFHPIITHQKGLHREWVCFGRDGMVEPGLLAMLFDLERHSGAESEPSLWRVEHRHLVPVRFFPKAIEAYRAARSARFEHGETPA